MIQLDDFITFSLQYGSLGLVSKSFLTALGEVICICQNMNITCVRYSCKSLCPGDTCLRMNTMALHRDQLPISLGLEGAGLVQP